jgi:serine/threonine-protein kinase
MAIRATKPATPAAVAAQQDIGSARTMHPDPGKGGGKEVEPRLPAGTMVSDRYRISRVLGEGGMGVVYAAEHVLMRKEVAVKVLHAEMCTMDEVVARFEREAIAAAHIDHPNVAGATDFGRLEDGSCYLVLELLKGTSLRDEIARGAIPPSRALRILRGIASGVSAAHVKGIVHRDLKPENVMIVDRDGDADFVKVLDFGIAKVDPTTLAAMSQGGGKVLTRVGAVFGTPEYMAPEQAVGDTVDARADLYSIGVIFLEMVTGRCPFRGNALSILRERILAVGPPDMSTVTDQGVRDIVSRLLTRQPDDRMQSATELVAAIDALLGERISALPAANSAGALSGGLPPSPTATTGFSLEKEAPARRRWMIPVAIVAALSVSAGAFGVVTVLGRPKPHVPHPMPKLLPSVEPSAVASSPETTPEPPPPAASVEPPAPPPTTSASTARSPRPKAPARRPPPKKSGGGINIPAPSTWFK